MGYVADKNTVINFIKGISNDRVDGTSILVYTHPVFETTYQIVRKINCGTEEKPRYADIPIASFTLKQMIGCCGILVSTNTYVDKKYQGQGIAHEFMELKIAIAKELGYSMMMSTVDIGNNPAEVHILEKFGWKKIQEFVNKRTKHTLGIFTYDII